MPVLAFDGLDDDSVPIDPAKELAAHPDRVTLVEVADAGQFLSWNVEPDTYEKTVLEHVARTLDV